MGKKEQKTNNAKYAIFANKEQIKMQIKTQKMIDKYLGLC